MQLYPWKSPDDTHWWPTVTSAASAPEAGVSWTHWGRVVSSAVPQPSWGWSALHSSWIAAVSALGSPSVCACGGSGVSLGARYSVPGWWSPWTRTDAHSYRQRAYVCMLRWTCIHVLSRFSFRAMGSWYNEHVLHMIVHIYFQGTGRRKPLRLLRSVGGADETLIPRCREQQLYSGFTSPPKVSETCPVGWGTSMITDVLNQAFLSTSMLVSHGGLAGARHGPATPPAEVSTSSCQTRSLCSYTDNSPHPCSF